MADNTESNAKLNEPFVGVADDEYDGRTFTHEDNEENVGAYVGVDPIYQNYANEGEKPYPFSEEELVAAAERGGLEADEVFVDGDDEGNEDDEPDSKSDEKETAAVTAPSVPTQRKATSTTRAAAKDTKSEGDEKK